MRRDLERRWATLRRSTLELSKKFQPYCSSEAVERRRIRPLEVVGTPPLVITLPVLSMPPCLDPAREALVPTLWKPVLSLPLVVGRIMGLAWVLAFLKEVPTRAKRLASSSLIICQAMPSSSVSSSSTQFSLMRHWHLSIQAASSFPFFSNSWSQTWMASAYLRRWQREWARMKSILYSERQMISKGILGRAWSTIRTSHCGRNMASNRMPRRWFSSSKERQEVSQMMNEKIAVMKQTLMKTTPRGFSILFILASVPAFYFINEMLQREYGDPQFVNSSTRFYKYYYLYNLTFFACGMALSRFNFHNPSSKYTIRKTNVTSAALPFLLSFIGLMIPQTDNKHLVWPALVTQIGTLVVQGVMVNKGMLPFWFYSYRHYIGLFYFIMFLINFTAMKRLEDRRTTHSHEFVQVQ